MVFFARKFAVGAALVLASAAPAAAQGGTANLEVLTNESITQMVAGKVPKDIILTKIRTTKSNFDLTPTGLIGLHTNKVSDETIKVMFQSMPASAPKEVLNDDAVIQMVNGQLSKDVILLKIQSSRSDFDLTTNGIIKLNQAKVSQDVVKAMMAASAGNPPPKKP